jgi:hypothetical protein
MCTTLVLVVLDFTNTFDLECHALSSNKVGSFLLGLCLTFTLP